MANVTISIDDKTLKESRDYAKRHNTSLNALIRQMLKQRVSSTNKAWIDECISMMDSAGASSGGINWTRDDLYDV